MRLIVFVLAVLSCVVQSAAQAKVRVFSCEPEWAALAREIGGDKVQTFAATSARQDPHYIRARPSLIAKARVADLLLCSGAGLEVGWLPVLLQKAGADVQPGADGYLMAADVALVLGKTATVDRRMGDVHPQGNPHVHLDPHNVALVGAELARRLSKIDAANAAYYQGRQRDFSSRWREAVARWEARARKLKGEPVVVHHKSFTYLLHWLGIREVAALEPRPGLPPTASHLQSLLHRLRNGGASMILRAPYDADDASEWLSAKTGIRMLVLPYTVGGDERSGDLFSLFDRTIELMTEHEPRR